MATRYPDTYIARQPIRDRQGRVVAYELLFRDNPQQSEAAVSDDVLATSRVVTRAFDELGLGTVVGRSRAFINVNAELLMSRMIEALDRERVVLELLETIEIDDGVVRRCHTLKRKGFSLALDDVVCYRPEYEPLLDTIDVIKIDIQQLDTDALARLVARLQGRRPRLLAEKVDTIERARECLALGFSYVQGFLFGRPAVLAA